MTWLTEPARRRDLILGMIFVATVCWLYERWAIGRHAQSISDSAAAIREAIDELKGMAITQSNNQNIQLPSLPPTEAELRDQRLREIHRTQGTIVEN